MSIILIVIISAALIGCCLLAAAFFGFARFVSFFENQTRSSEVESLDEFYTFRSGNDFRVIPLSKPYQLLSIDNATWTMELFSDSIPYQFQVKDIDTVAIIENGPIILYATNTTYNGESYAEAWFVVDPQTMDEAGFTSKTELENHLSSINVRRYQQHRPEQLYEELSSTGTLSWFP